MNVILHTADENRRAIKSLGNTAENGVECLAINFVAKKWPTIFRGKDQMNVNGRKGLRHGMRMPIVPVFAIAKKPQTPLGLMRFWERCPRVAPSRNPWA